MSPTTIALQGILFAFFAPLGRLGSGVAKIQNTSEARFARAAAKNTPSPTMPTERDATKLALFFSGRTTVPGAFTSVAAICRNNGFTTADYVNELRYMPFPFHRQRLEDYLHGMWLHWRHGLQELLLVGHGSGGLLARAVVESGIVKDVPRLSLITAGTAHQRLCRSLPEIDERYLRVPFLNIVGGYDEVVPRIRTYHPQAHVRQFDLGHHTLLGQKEPLDAIQDFLRNGKPTIQVNTKTSLAFP